MISDTLSQQAVNTDTRTSISETHAVQSAKSDTMVQTAVGTDTYTQSSCNTHLHTSLNLAQPADNLTTSSETYTIQSDKSDTMIQMAVDPETHAQSPGNTRLQPILNLAQPALTSAQLLSRRTALRLDTDPVLPAILAQGSNTLGAVITTDTLATAPPTASSDTLTQVMKAPAVTKSTVKLPSATPDTLAGPAISAISDTGTVQVARLPDATISELSTDTLEAMKPQLPPQHTITTIGQQTPILQQLDTRAGTELDTDTLTDSTYFEHSDTASDSQASSLSTTATDSASTTN